VTADAHDMARTVSPPEPCPIGTRDRGNQYLAMAEDGAVYAGMDHVHLLAPTPDEALCNSGRILFRPIGRPRSPYGGLSELLGRALMLRTSRREDRKQVSPYVHP